MMKRFRMAFLYYLRKNEPLRLIIGSIMLAVCSFFEVTVGVAFASLAVGLMTIVIVISCFACDMPELVRFGFTRASAMSAAAAESLGVSLLYGIPIASVLAISELLQCNGLGMVGAYLLIWICAIPIAWMLGLIGALCIRKFGQNGIMAIYFIYLGLFTVIPILSDLLDDIGFVQGLIELFNENLYLLVALGALAAIPISILLVRSLSRVDV